MYVWAQLLKHCSTNAEAMGSNPVEVPKFFPVNLQLLKLQLLLRRSYLRLNMLICICYILRVLMIMCPLKG